MEIARTLKEADALWADGKYDLLVLDVSLPDGTGFEFCKKVRQISKVPIIFLTASDEEMNIIMGLDIGGDDYITKPFKLGGACIEDQCSASEGKEFSFSRHGINFKWLRKTADQLSRQERDKSHDRGPER